MLALQQRADWIENLSCSTDLMTQPNYRVP